MNRFKNFCALALITLVTLQACSDDDETTSAPEMNPNVANQQPLGTSASELLSSDTFTSMRVEIAYPQGFRPQDETIAALRPFLEQRLDKPDGITIVENVITTDEQAPYDINEIVAIEEANRTIFNNEDEIGVWIFFSNGNSENDTDTSVILGTAYRNTSMVVFEKTFMDLESASQTPINRNAIEITTIKHEFGHLFGLVNIGTPLSSPHEDASNTRHCEVENCLMYFQTVNDVFNNSMMAELPEFDDLCIADLQANGGL